jgi:2-C-methyl-D-erythritol 4-phosphate cytidylyltransferase / 2-C-methyl-D-erythritol 2,4-cyclodiphosphate synthase
MAEPVVDAIVVAAGASRRMGGIDKLEADVGGRPMLAWSVDAMAGSPNVRNVIVVAAESRLEALGRAARLDEGRLRVVEGGEQRSDSVLAGVRASDADILLVHDGARPLATPALAEAVGRAAAEHGAAVPVLAVADSVKRAQAGRIVAAVDREGLVRAQTPQGARRNLLLAAFEAAAGASFTDEAALLEANGVPVATVDGDPLNIKVTGPADLETVRAIVAARAGATTPRIGAGHDSHPFGPEDGLWLGGVLFAEAPRLYGHSDGDVALHAIGTAVLSGCGLGDLGRAFPATDPEHRGAAGARLLSAVIGRAAQAGWRPANVHLSLLGARPRLGAERLESMRRRIADLVGLEPDDVALAASSGNLGGAEGAGRAITASAIVTLVRQ